VEEIQSNKGTATDLRHETRATLEYIIEHIPEGELRTSLMTLPEVRQLVEIEYLDLSNK
jgi:hypothetical protein